MRNNTKEHMEHIRSLRSKGKYVKKTFETNFTEEELNTYLKGIPENYQYAYRKAFSGTRSLKVISKAKCLDCVGFEEVRNNIRECSVKFCPLWPWRPYR